MCNFRSITMKKRRSLSTDLAVRLNPDHVTMIFIPWIEVLRRVRLRSKLSHHMKVHPSRFNCLTFRLLRDGILLNVECLLCRECGPVPHHFLNTQNVIKRLNRDKRHYSNLGELANPATYDKYRDQVRGFLTQLFYPLEPLLERYLF